MKRHASTECEDAPTAIVLKNGCCLSVNFLHFWSPRQSLSLGKNSFILQSNNNGFVQLRDLSHRTRVTMTGPDVTLASDHFFLHFLTHFFGNCSTLLKYIRTRSSAQLFTYIQMAYFCKNSVHGEKLLISGCTLYSTATWMSDSGMRVRRHRGGGGVTRIH